MAKGLIPANVLQCYQELLNQVDWQRVLSDMGLSEETPADDGALQAVVKAELLHLAGYVTGIHTYMTYTIKEAAELTGKTEAAIRKAVSEGRLQSEQRNPGQAHRFKGIELKRWHLDIPAAFDSEHPAWKVSWYLDSVQTKADLELLYREKESQSLESHFCHRSYFNGYLMKRTKTGKPIKQKKV